ncbi:hypothetical protein OJ996_18850 [Luteolibacter sp. GHJ8]|uniref:WD40 repeat protein n=1 Tax=Luteolibacter rhizosphaerae TaxID=2989719 RepID=A0ABT3G728_9BACT|nr:hypothetical protein [Luteolibacter rhizosphaerae]MCW1915652.1 hypothetical protein [Luteolibacter rhizosphaerae]
MNTNPPPVYAAGAIPDRAPSPSHRQARPSLRSLVPALAFALLAALPASATTGTIYYNSYSTAPAMNVRAIGVDGSNARTISLPVPSPALPVVSRDGRWLLTSSGGPLAHVMLSQNVFRTDLTNGATTQVTRFMDTYSDGITIYENPQGEPEFDTYSYYTTHLPNHKAFSPTGDRVATLDLAAVSGKQPGGVRLPATQSPVLEVYPVPQTTPVATWLAGGTERTGVNQAGDGLDWHPTREEMVGTFRSNIPLTSNISSGGFTEGTVLQVYASSGTTPLLRPLTAPTGRSYYDFSNFYIQSETEQDYAPSISRDGSKVAYVRNTLFSDSRVAGGAIRLVRCAIRIINYDGSGDRELIAFGNNFWITKLAWSPDGTEIAFDAAPRLVSNGLELQMGNMAQSAIYIVKASDAAHRLLVPAPAAHPTWSPLGATLPADLPLVRAVRAGSTLQLQMSNLTVARQYDIEVSTNLGQWTTDQTITAAAASQTVNYTIAPGVRARFFRVRPR